MFYFYYQHFALVFVVIFVWVEGGGMLVIKTNKQTKTKPDLHMRSNQQQYHRKIHFHYSVATHFKTKGDGDEQHGGQGNMYS